MECDQDMDSSTRGFVAARYVKREAKARITGLEPVAFASPHRSPPHRLRVAVGRLTGHWKRGARAGGV